LSAVFLLRKIEKTRYCVPMGELTAEIDVFPFWSDRAFCEVELPHEDTPVTLPEWLDVVREVSADKRYTNLALAREIPMEEL
jgi:CYTH domain-containing protein